MPFTYTHCTIGAYSTNPDINEEIIDKDARDSEEMKKYLNMDQEDKLLGAFVFGEVDPGRQFKSTRRPIEVEFRTE